MIEHNQNLPVTLCNFLSKEALSIFLFHGVIEKQIDRVKNYTKKHIEKDLFANCIKLLSEKGTPLSMDQVLYHLENQIPFPKNAFALTFDDGFENNVSVAAPIITDYKVPATIYVTSNFIDMNYMSWIDRIESAVQKVDVIEHKFYWMEEVVSLKNDLSKIDFLKKVRKFVKNTPTCNPNEFADELCYSLEKQIVTQSTNPLDLKMSWEQVKAMHESEFFTIGGHSHTHVILSFLDENSLDYELDTSINMLSQKAGISPIHYSYPEGLSHCYNFNVITGLKKRGIKCCPTAIHGTNKLDTNSFELKRILVS